MDLANAMKLVAEWSQTVGVAARAFADKLPENTAQKATAMMLLKSILDVQAAAEDLDKVALRFFTTMKAIHDCGGALETEFGGEFTDAVPGPPIQITFGQVAIIQPTASCSCGCADADEDQNQKLN